VSFGNLVKKFLERLNSFITVLGKERLRAFWYRAILHSFGTGRGFGVLDLILMMYYGFEMILHR